MQINAQYTGIIEEEVRKTQVAEQQCKLRQNKHRTWAQKGGALYVSQAREQVISKFKEKGRCKAQRVGNLMRK
jgi:hypothetical protein